MKKNNLRGICLLSCAALPWCGRAAAQDADRSGYFCESIRQPFYVRTGSGDDLSPVRNKMLPERFSARRPEGVRRVFLLGESAAVILRDGAEIIDIDVPGGWTHGGMSRYGALLGGGGERVEMLNFGMGGYDSYRISAILSEILNYSPDLLVLFSGNHEGVTEMCPGLEFDLRRRQSRLLEHYYSVKDGDDQQQARKKASLKMHREMLEKMARAAKKKKVPLLFCTLPVNVRGLPSRMPLSLAGEPFAAGYRLFYDGKYAQALEKFRLALKDRPRGHFENFYAARTLDKLGEPAQAGAYYFSALAFDPEMNRADRARNDMIKETAAAEGVCVADLEKLFRDLSPDGLPGFGEFSDGMHWRPEYNKAVWNEVFRAAAACAVKGFGKFSPAKSGPVPAPAREEALRRLNYAFFGMDRQGLNEAVLAELSRVREEEPGLLREAAVSPEKLGRLLISNFWTAGMQDQFRTRFPLLLAHLAETERRAKNYGGALELCRRALELEPGSGRFRLERAQVLAGLGRNAEAAAEFLALASETSDISPEARSLALAYGFAPPAAAPGRTTAK